MHQLHRYHQPGQPVRVQCSLKEIPHHKRQHQNHLNTKADNGRNHIGNGRGQPGKVDLSKNVGIGGKHVGVVDHTGGEVAPDGVAAQIEQECGNPVGADARNAAEHKGVDDTGKQRRQEEPRGAQNRLLVAHRKIALGKQDNQIPVPPDLPEIQVKHAVSGGNVGVIGGMLCHRITSFFG